MNYLKKSNSQFGLLILLILYVFSGAAFAQVDSVELTTDVEIIDMNRVAKFARVDASMQLSDIMTEQQAWRSDFDILPLHENEALWAKVSFHYLRADSSRFTFLLSNPNLDFVDIFVIDNRGRIKLSAMVGAKRPFSNRPINFREFAVPFELQFNERFDIYFRIQDDGPLVFKSELWKSTALIKKVQANLTMIGAFSGALAILACYFLVTYIMLHSPIRFWFSTANLVFLLLFLNLEGILGQATGLTQFMLPTTFVLLATAVFCATKVSHEMLVNAPIYWRRVNYVVALCFILIALIPNAFWQIEMAAGLGCAILLLQLGLSIAYRNPFNSLPNRLLIAGWGTISLTNLVHVVIFLMGNQLGTRDNLAISLLIMVGILLIAVAVEAHEKVIIRKQYEQQRTTIDDLQRFYDIFRNSAEGLFSSAYDGRLISVNPAMCHLFGYENETEMLQERKNASQFYVNAEDRDLLIGQLLKEGTIVGKEVKGVRKDGTEFWFSVSVQMREEDGVKLLFGSLVDITERKQSDISLKYMATHDSLTGVYNRNYFEGQLSEALARSQESGFQLTLLYLDLDQFKTVNDSCGHKAGDALIKQLSQKLNDVVAQKGVFGRMGGDEFAVMLSDENADLGYTVAHQLLNVVRDYRFIWDNRMFTLGVSIGLVEFREEVRSADQLMSMADSACYLAKQRGRDQIHVYSTEDAHLQKYEADLESISLINEAIEDNRFVLFYQHYQPLQRLKQGHHYELLVRVQKEDGTIIPPAAFLPAAERYNLSSKIDKWVLENYLKWLSENPEHLDKLARANINLCGISLGDKDLKLYFLNAFEKYNIPYSKICFEITESMAIVKLDETLEFINTFHDLGCKFALDDFGIGFSSYEHLKKLPVDYVKIDGSFVKDILVDPIDMAMVGSMKDVAQAMGILTVAEYVETSEIMAELGKMGVDYAQGYGVAKPQALDEFKVHVALENE